MRLSGADVEEQHARFALRSQRVVCRALTGDPDDPRSETRSWVLPDAPMRAGVDYLLAPGSRLSFGRLGDNVVVVNYEVASGGGEEAMAQMLMDGMAQGASGAVKARIGR